MTKQTEGKKGEFETFRSDWLLQVAADRGAKSASPAAIIIACRHLNRKTGTAWPSIETLAGAIAADAPNTVRNIYKLLEVRGHAHIEWTKGGQKRTHIVTPLVNGQPFKNLGGLDATKGGVSLRETLQVSAPKPFRKLKGNHLKEPLEEPIEGGGASAQPARSNILDSSSLDRPVTSEAINAPSSAPRGASGAIASELHIRAHTRIHDLILAAPAEAIIAIMDEEGTTEFRRYMRNRLPDVVVKRLVSFLQKEKLTVGMVLNAIDAERRQEREEA